MDFRLPIPKNWQDFESICQKLWREIWNDPNTKKNGRQGQAQSGVDVFGKPVYADSFHGVQCKDKNSRLGSSLSQAELLREVKKAQSFTPTLGAFTMATTAERDQSIQAYARKLTENKRIPFEVNVWSWDDIEEEIQFRPMIMDHYYPKVSTIQKEPTIISLNRLSSNTNMEAFLSRPAISSKLSPHFISFLRPLIYELAENSYSHGQATDFRIELNGQKIIFTDNGSAFDPLVELDAAAANSYANLGSYIFDSFRAEFSPGMEYQREDNKNILSLEFHPGVFELESDHLEINIDPSLIPTRAAAAAYANNVPLNKEEIVLSMENLGALSSLSALTSTLLGKMSPGQKLTLIAPRHGYITQFAKYFNDPRLTIKTR